MHQESNSAPGGGIFRVNGQRHALGHASIDKEG